MLTLNRSLHPRLALGAALLAFAGGCAVGPNYRRPTSAVSSAFKEADGWRPAAPADGSARGPWWEAFADPVLNDLEGRAAAGNLTVVQAAANYEEARQLARSDETGFLPGVTADGSATRAHASSAAGGGPAVSSYAGSLQAGWTPDFWGRLRRTTEADVATAQAGAADLASARLSIGTGLAQDYVQLRSLDAKAALLGDAVNDYARTVTITQNKYGVGVAARSDVISAQTQLDSTRAQQIDVGVQRAQFEHAIAVLMGESPSGFSITPRSALNLSIPSVPPLLPSELLERRPDVAAAEREVAAANARIGIQTAAYFPDFTLSAEGGYQGSPLHRLFSAPFRFWSLGADVSDSLLDWGQRSDEVRASRAAYEGSVANYRETVLGAVQQVEDSLSGSRILADESRVEAVAVTEGTEAAHIALNEYNAGTVDYTTVAAAQVTDLNNREAALTINENRLLAATALIQATGGGWSSADLPAARRVLASRP